VTDVEDAVAVSFVTGTGSPLYLSTEKHEWRYETYGLVWKPKGSRLQQIIPWHRIWEITISERKAIVPDGTRVEGRG
jgi:hypothetical protein